MEERKLNEKESLELIAQMIQNTKNRMETNCGMPFPVMGIHYCIYQSVSMASGNIHTE